jgi:hypothetical protein
MANKEPSYAEMLKILTSIMSRPESGVFHEPVDWEGLGLVDYPDIVKNPMDLGTVKEKIEDDKYDSVEEVANDIRLVWSNCMLYNRDGSEYYHLADTFARSFEEAYSALRRLEHSKSDDVGRVPSVNERLQLSYDLFKIDNIEMGRVLTMVEGSCPSALSRKISFDEVLINLDALSPHIFHEVNSFVLSCLVNSGGSKKKKRPESTSSSGDRTSSKIKKKART